MGGTTGCLRAGLSPQGFRAYAYDCSGTTLTFKYLVKPSQSLVWTSTDIPDVTWPGHVLVSQHCKVTLTISETAFTHLHTTASAHGNL